MFGKTKVLLVLLVGVLLAACGGNSQVVVVTNTPQPTETPAPTVYATLIVTELIPVTVTPVQPTATSEIPGGICEGESATTASEAGAFFDFALAERAGPIPSGTSITVCFQSHQGSDTVYGRINRSGYAFGIWFSKNAAGIALETSGLPVEPNHGLELLIWQNQTSLIQGTEHAGCFSDAGVTLTGSIPPGETVTVLGRFQGTWMKIQRTDGSQCLIGWGYLRFSDADWPLQVGPDRWPLAP